MFAHLKGHFSIFTMTTNPQPTSDEEQKPQEPKHEKPWSFWDDERQDMLDDYD